MDAYSAPRKEFAINMHGMIKLPRMSRLALAVALLFPGMAHASELTPEQIAWYRVQMGLASMAAAPPSASNSVGDALIEWRRLTQDQTASFDRLSRFLMANKGWPDADKMRTRAEKAIAIDSRSEEHTSELQSLMRTSYAVFCLQKKKNSKRMTSIRSYKVNSKYAYLKE